MKKFISVVINFIMNFVIAYSTGVAALLFNTLINYAAENGMNSNIFALIWCIGMFSLFEGYRWVKNKWVTYYKWVYNPSLY